MYLFMADIANSCLCAVMGPGFVSTSPAFMRNSGRHPAGPHGRLEKKTVNRDPIDGVGGFDTICNRRDRSTAYRLCLLKPLI